MRQQIVCAIAILCMSGCAPAALLPAQAAAGLVQSVDTTATTLFTGESSVRLNGANLQLAQAQTRLTLSKAAASALEEERLARERVVTAHLLNEMSHTYHDPLLETLAQWVAGGGDPDFAFKYALMQVNPNLPQVKVIPPQPALLRSHDRPVRLGQAAHSSPLCRTPLPGKSPQVNPEIIHQDGTQPAKATRA